MGVQMFVSEASRKHSPHGSSRRARALDQLRSIPTKRIALLVGTLTLTGAFLALPGIVEGGRNWLELACKVGEMWAWAPLIPSILAADRKLKFSDRQIPLRIAAHVPLCLIFSAIHVCIASFILYPISAIWWNPLRVPAYIEYAFEGSCVMYILIVGISEALRYHERYLASELQKEILERSLLQTNLCMLRMQLEPHFLFNALNAISSQVVSDAKLARDMIEDLGALLRLSLEFRNSHEISLAEELKILEHYLAIQKVRFGSRLIISSCIDPAVRFASVPSLLIQPLVENAIHHGISRRASGGTVKISAQRVGDNVEIHVTDDGIGLPVGWQIETSAGVGLAVTRERLTGLYPNGTSRFDVKRREDGGTDVVVTLPMREIGRGANEPVPV